MQVQDMKQQKQFGVMKKQLMTTLKTFYNFEKIERAWGKFFLLFFPQITDEPCYEARQLSHNVFGLGEVAEPELE